MKIRTNTYFQQFSATTAVSLSITASFKNKNAVTDIQFCVHVHVSSLLHYITLQTQLPAEKILGGLGRVMAT